MPYYHGVRMSVREKQFRMNLDSILGGVENSVLDGYLTEEEVHMNADEWFEYVMTDMYHFKVVAPGVEVYRDNICRDLRFLGNARMKEIIIEEVEKEGWLIN